jgi:hypothetical protein
MSVASIFRVLQVAIQYNAVRNKLQTVLLLGGYSESEWAITLLKK